MKTKSHLQFAKRVKYTVKENPWEWIQSYLGNKSSIVSGIGISEAFGNLKKMCRFFKLLL